MTMTVKEKLIQLMDEAHDEFYRHFDPNRGYMETLADVLIANGVMFAKWEPIAGDQAPTGVVLAYSQKSEGMAVGCLEVWFDEDEKKITITCENGLEPLYNVTHWMPKPEPPKEAKKK